jgi:hypothetical protein
LIPVIGGTVKGLSISGYYENIPVTAGFRTEWGGDSASSDIWFETALTTLESEKNWTARITVRRSSRAAPRWNIMVVNRRRREEIAAAIATLPLDQIWRGEQFMRRDYTSICLVQRGNKLIYSYRLDSYNPDACPSPEIFAQILDGLARLDRSLHRFERSGTSLR